MDDSEQNKVVDKKNFGLEAQNIPQPDNTEVTLGISSQSTSEPMSLTAQSVELSQPQPKSKKKIGVIVLAVVLAFGVVGGAAWLVLTNSGSNDGPREAAGKDEDSSNNQQIEVNPESKAEVITLSLDDQLVQRLYGQFDFALSQFIWTGLFEDISDETKLEFAIATSPSTTICKDRYGLFYGDGEYDPNTFTEPWPVRGEHCVDGDTVKATIKEVFGSEITLENKQIVGIHCSVFCMTQIIMSLLTYTLAVLAHLLI